MAAFLPHESASPLPPKAPRTNQLGFLGPWVASEDAFWATTKLMSDGVTSDAGGEDTTVAAHIRVVTISAKWRSSIWQHARASGFTRSPRGDQSCGLERSSLREPSERSSAHF